LTDEVIELVANSEKFCPHFHIPLQSGSEKILRMMQRRYQPALYRSRMEKIKLLMPHACIGADVIVGFPGETDEEFGSLLEFIERARFERLGIFKYSREDGSRAAKMPDQVSIKTKNARYRAAMSIQQKIAHEIAREKIGRELKLLIDQPLVARTDADAPDVDARVILSQPAPIGEFVMKQITGARGYDLLA